MSNLRVAMAWVGFQVGWLLDQRDLHFAAWNVIFAHVQIHCYRLLCLLCLCSLLMYKLKDIEVIYDNNIWYIKSKVSPSMQTFSTGEKNLHRWLNYLSPIALFSFRYVMKSTCSIRWHRNIYKFGRTKNKSAKLKFRIFQNAAMPSMFNVPIIFGRGKLRLSMICTNVSTSLDNLGLNFFSSPTVVTVCPLKHNWRMHEWVRLQRA